MSDNCCHWLEIPAVLSPLAKTRFLRMCVLVQTVITAVVGEELLGCAVVNGCEAEVLKVFAVEKETILG